MASLTFLVCFIAAALIPTVIGGATINVSPSVVERSGDWVKVTWTGVESPSSDDLIAVYTANGTSSVDIKMEAPLKYQKCSVSPMHLTSGSGSVCFRLVNVRQDLVFIVLQKALISPWRSNSATVNVAQSKSIRFKNYNEPLQGHLSLTTDSTEMMFTWVTKNSTNPYVKIGNKFSTYTKEIKAISSTYTAKDMCGYPANDYGFINPGTIHMAKFTGLVPNQIYHYVFGDDDFGWSSDHTFMAPPLVDQSSLTRVITYGDMGMGQADGSMQPVTEQYNSLNTTKQILKDIKPGNFILHIGDISYARGYEGVWDEFFDQIFPIATQVPYMVCIGNHERDFPNSGSLFEGSDSGGECGVPYEKRFPMPRVAEDSPWYGFSYGSAHFVIMSTEHNFNVSSSQYKWLDNHLSKVDRESTPWLIFTGHRPMYVDSTPGADKLVAVLLKMHIEPLLLKYEVDLALWGHHHSYQRTCHVREGACSSEKDPVHVIIGMAGQSLSELSSQQPPWIEYADATHFGYSRISTSATTLLFEYVRNNDGQVHDQLKLYK